MDYDLLVIGSGSAAFAAGIEARSLGASVALVERETLGGTCVNVGCVPSKTLLAAAEIAARAVRHSFDGLHASVGPVDLGAVVDQKNDLVDDLRKAKYATVADAHGIELISGQARFVTEHSINVDARAVSARSILIAAGAEPAVPDIPGLTEIDFLTSTTAMQLRSVPKRLVVIGAGFVGVEQAQLFARLGSRVSLIGPLLATAEPELAALLDDALVASGIVRCGTKAVGVDKTSDGIVVRCEDGSSVVGDRVLVAAGRRPRTATLGLDRVGVEVDARGHIKIDAAQRTSNSNIWAAGDVATGPQFVYVAATSGRIAARNALTGSHDTVDYTGLPQVAFTTPQLGWAGLTEAEARRHGHTIETRTLNLDQVPRAIANRETHGAIKLVADAHDHRLLGAHVLADHGGELLYAATIAIKAGWTVEQLASTWAPYLTMNEGLKLTAQSFATDVKELSCCAS
jgi:mercuric reductase